MITRQVVVRSEPRSLCGSFRSTLVSHSLNLSGGVGSGASLITLSYLLADGVGAALL